jgi:hypothetical protein
MQSVVETDEFLRASHAAGIDDAGRESIVTLVASNPVRGDLIVGAGGCRKLRVAGRGKGKSGGYRLITFYGGPQVPVFLVTIFSKGERADLTKAERNGLAKLAGILVDSLGRSWLRRSGA